MDRNITCQHCHKVINGCMHHERVTRTCEECYNSDAQIAAEADAAWKDYQDEQNGAYAR